MFIRISAPGATLCEVYDFRAFKAAAIAAPKLTPELREAIAPAGRLDADDLMFGRRPHGCFRSRHQTRTGGKASIPCFHMLGYRAGPMMRARSLLICSSTGTPDLEPSGCVERT